MGSENHPGVLQGITTDFESDKYADTCLLLLSKACPSVAQPCCNGNTPCRKLGSTIHSTRSITVKKSATPFWCSCIFSLSVLSLVNNHRIANCGGVSVLTPSLSTPNLPTNYGINRCIDPRPQHTWTYATRECTKHTQCSDQSVVIFCIVFSLKFQLPVGLHNNKCTGQTANGTFQKINYKISRLIGCHRV